MNTKKLFKTKEMVKIILENDERARNSDTHLYRVILYKFGQMKGIDIGAMTIDYFYKNINSLGIPHYNTVERARRKVQEEHPELAGTDDVEAQRVINERVYRDFARRKRSE